MVRLIIALPVMCLLLAGSGAAQTAFQCPIEVHNDGLGLRLLTVHISDFRGDDESVTAQVRASDGVSAGAGALWAKGENLSFTFSLVPLDGAVLQVLHVFRCPGGIFAGCPGREVQVRADGIVELANLYNVSLPFCEPLEGPPPS